ncbi:MAG: MCE family protein [Defluviicoccus sp.]|nr:MAG: MCE family protein [Defluviicoccus sp.]
MSKPADPKLIGAFVLGAIALITVGVLVIGGKFFQRTTPVVMYFEGSVAGLATGAPVNFRGVRVGQVTNVFIRYQPNGTATLEIPVFAEFSSQNIEIVAPGHDKKEVRHATDEQLRLLVEKGLRAQLTLPSLVTGQASITLDFFPGSPVQFVNNYPHRVEIPTVPSTLQEVQTTLQQLYTKLSKLPLDDLIDDARNLLKGRARSPTTPRCWRRSTAPARPWPTYSRRRTRCRRTSVRWFQTWEQRRRLPTARCRTPSRCSRGSLPVQSG